MNCIRSSSAFALWIALAFCNLARSDEVDWLRPDGQGNRIPDFSYCGYGASEVAIPNAPVRVVVKPVDGDDGARIQSAIDFVGALISNPLFDGLNCHVPEKLGLASSPAASAVVKNSHIAVIPIVLMILLRLLVFRCFVD